MEEAGFVKREKATVTILDYYLKTKCDADCQGVDKNIFKNVTAKNLLLTDV